MKIFSSLIIWSLAVIGQLAAEPFTVKAGLSKASLISSYDDRSLIGFHLGVSAGFALNSFLFISPELALVRRGTAEGLPQLGSLATARIIYDFLELPLLLDCRFGNKGSGFHPLLYAGIYGAYAVSAKGRISAGGQSWPEDLSGDSKRFDGGMIAGAGLEFPLFGQAFVCEGRFYRGFVQLNKVDYREPWKTTALSLLLGWRF